MRRASVYTLVCLMAVALLSLGAGCASSGPADASDVYYRRGSIHADSFPQTYGGAGYGRYGRYGRYGGYRRY